MTGKINVEKMKEDIIGCSLIEGKRKAVVFAYLIREVIRDDDNLPVTPDAKANRINVETRDGKIVKIINVG